jgi:hypothetical protein
LVELLYCAAETEAPKPSELHSTDKKLIFFPCGPSAQCG